MCLAAVALRFAFPHQPYMFRENYISESSNNSGPGSSSTTTTTGRIVTMQTISHNLKETMNPKDIMHGKFNSLSIDGFRSFILDAIHNFHPQYRDYTQYSANVKIISLKMSDVNCVVVSEK